MLEITKSILGPFLTNTYIVRDLTSRSAVIIDPADESCSNLIQQAISAKWDIRQIWITHAHFDHIGGIKSTLDALGCPIPIAAHSADLELWRSGGGASLFGLHLDLEIEPDTFPTHGQICPLGNHSFEVRYIPGHSPGHIGFYCAEEGVFFCGDALFRGSIGRTDFPGGDYNSLMHSIRTQILTLPDQTRLFPGHGDETTVQREKHSNPFLI